MVLTFSRMLPDVKRILKRHERVLHRSKRMTEIFKAPPILAYRRDKNLSDILVHTKTNAALKTNEPCKCDTCQCIYKEEIRDTSGKRHYYTATDITCNTNNIIYCLICKRCKKTVYVGETKRSIKERLYEHQRDIRLQEDKPIMKHFVGHSKNDVQIAVLQKAYEDNKTHRLVIEDEWIRKLNTKVPFGCNVQLNFH